MCPDKKLKSFKDHGHSAAQIPKISRSWLSLIGMKLTREMKNLPQPLNLLEEAR